MEAKVKKDRRITRTKEAINRAFVELFAEKTFDRITINDIAERANVNRATVYLHYADKYDLLDKCIEDHLNQMVTACSLNKSFQQKVTDLFEATEALKSLFAYFEDHFLFFSSMLSSQNTVAFRECMLGITKTLIQKQIDMEGANRGMDPEVTLQFTASAFVGTVEWWIANQMPHPPAMMAEQAMKLLKRHDIYCTV